MRLGGGQERRMSSLVLLAWKAFFPKDSFPGQSQPPSPGVIVTYSMLLLVALFANEGWSQFFHSSQDTNGHVLVFPMTPHLDRKSKGSFLNCFPKSKVSGYMFLPPHTTHLKRALQTHPKNSRVRLWRHVHVRRFCRVYFTNITPHQTM